MLVIKKLGSCTLPSESEEIHNEYCGCLNRDGRHAITVEVINLTPHRVNVGDKAYEPSGTVARVAVSYGEIHNGVALQSYGEVEGLPDPQPGTMYIVSGLVLGACQDRPDVVAPATGHPDVVRNEKGHIVGVPCFTQMA